MSSSLPGIWKLVRAERAGTDSPDLFALQIELELTADTYLVRFEGQIADRGTYTPGPDGPHRSLLLFGQHGPNEGRCIPGIYQQVGDRLRICYGLDGTAPTRFATSAGDQCYLATYQRKPA
jgi:uncharacterized protein (TIGR03067 family)